MTNDFLSIQRLGQMPQHDRDTNTGYIKEPLHDKETNTRSIQKLKTDLHHSHSRFTWTLWAVIVTISFRLQLVPSSWVR